MLIVTQEEDIRRGTEILEELSKAFDALRHQINALIEDPAALAATTPSEAKGQVSALRELLFQYVKAEAYLNDCKSKQAGIAQGGYALDLDRARADIGCKLDRLRRCGRPRAVPE